MAIPTSQVDSVAVTAFDEADAAAALEAKATADEHAADGAESPAEEADSSLEPISHPNDEELSA